MKVVLYILSLFLVGQLYSQILTPGGVGDPLHWMLNQADPDGETSWQDLQHANSPTTAADLAGSLRFNTWGVPVWSSVTTFQEFAISDKHWAGATLFLVYQTNAPPNEQVLWSWEPSNRRPLLYTNQRMADLEKQQYLNRSNTDQQIRLHTFYQTNKEAGNGDGVFRIGQKPPSQQLPITNWKGGIAEFIFYSRVLSPRQRLGVESYLALKYGITLGKGKDYLRSDGEVIWDAKQHQDFHHRIVGLGSDEASNWQQYHSQPAESPDDIRISLRDAPTFNGLPGPAIPDQTFWILGDNDAPLNWEYQTNNQQILQRHWLLQTQGAASSLSTNIRLDLGRWLITSSDEVTYFLAIDRSGKGNFTGAATELIPLHHLSLGRFGHFENIHWDTDGSGTDQFAIIRRGNPAHLNPSSEAFLRVYPNPLGAQAPWQWQLTFPELTNLRTTLTTLQGQILVEKNWTPATYFAAEEAPLPAGVYLLNFHYEGKTRTQKLIVQ
jgi:hypothetical protein